MTDDSDAVVLSDETLSLVADLRETRETIKMWKAREDSIRTVLLTELQDVEFGVTADGSPVIEVQRQPRTRVDSKKLQALYEEVWKDCQVETEVEVLRLPETPAV